MEQEGQKIAQLAESASAYYLAEGYHVDDHREQVIDRSLRLGSIAARYGVASDAQVLLLASSWHDAGIAMNPVDFLVDGQDGHLLRPALFSEEVSAELFKRQADRIGLPGELTNEVAVAILGTNPTMDLPTVESQIVAAADLFGVGFDAPEEFVSTTKKLWKEASWRAGHSIAWEDFVEGSITYLGSFMRRSIKLTEQYIDEAGRSAWHVGAAANILHLAEQTWPGMFVDVEWHKPSAGSYLPIRITPPDGKTNLTIFVPIIDSIASLPEQCVDQLKIDESMVFDKGRLEAASRILKSSGEMIVS